MLNISVRRLINQQLVGPAFSTPVEVVKWMGAVQAQDYLGALWAIGSRMKESTVQDVERAIANRSILRTWPMRGTIHFVPAKDARWMIDLMAARQIERAQGRYKNLGLTEDVFVSAREVFIKALEGDHQRTRGELYALLETAGIPTGNGRGLQIIGRLAQEGLICFAFRFGKQPTFALLDEWAPNARVLHREEALAGLALRYFLSHGPATMKDFVWWTGLKVADAQAGLEAIKSYLVHESNDGRIYWWGESQRSDSADQIKLHLLPSYDEYMVGYKDRNAALGSGSAWLMDPQNHLRSSILVGGKVAGLWRRTINENSVLVESTLVRTLTNTEENKFEAAVQRYGNFLGKPIVLEKGTILVGLPEVQ